MTYGVSFFIMIFMGFIVADVLIGFSTSWRITPVPFMPEKTTVQEKEEKVVEFILPTMPVLIGDVPFTSQAPFGNWNNSIYQEGCEEASILMAIYWTRGEVLTPEKADIEIKNIADFEMEAFGAYLDTSVYDTAKVMKDYFAFNQYRIKENITKIDIIQSLSDGNIVLVPTFGRDLKNPYYNPPGPIEHMIVITGYDPVKKEFITNDPGTKNGKGFTYNEDILFGSLWSYPTSSKKLSPPGHDEKRKKDMIEIYK